MATLPNVEILSTGEWYDSRGEKISITQDTLDGIIANFSRFRDALKPFVKLGHGDTQVLAQAGGQPALGWVSRLYRRGRKLVADLVDVPKLLLEAIQAGRYKRVSCEFFEALERTTLRDTLGDPDASGPALLAVAILGAELPAITDLEDLPQLLAQDGLSDVTTCAAPVSSGAIAVAATDLHRLARADTYADGSLLGFQRAVQAELDARYPYVPELEQFGYVLRELFPDAVIIEAQGTLLQLDVQDADGEITLSDPMQVRPSFVSFIHAESTERGDRQTGVDDMGDKGDKKEVATVDPAALAAAVDQAVTAALEKRDAEVAKELTAKDETIKRLGADLATIQDAQRQADARATQVEAERFADGLMRADAPRITQAMRPYVVALCAKLDDRAVMLTADEGKALALFGDEDTPADLSSRECFRRLLQALPPIRMREVARQQPNGADHPETWHDVVCLVAKERGLDARQPDQLLQATKLAFKDPRFAAQAQRYARATAE